MTCRSGSSRARGWVGGGRSTEQNGGHAAQGSGSARLEDRRAEPGGRQAEIGGGRAYRGGQHADQGSLEEQGGRAEGGDKRAEAESVWATGARGGGSHGSERGSQTGQGGRGTQQILRSYDGAADSSLEYVNSDVKSQASSFKGEAKPRRTNFAKYMWFPRGKYLQSFVNITY